MLIGESAHGANKHSNPLQELTTLYGKGPFGTLIVVTNFTGSLLGLEGLTWRSTKLSFHDSRLPTSLKGASKRLGCDL